MSFFFFFCCFFIKGPPRIQSNEQKSLQVARLGQEFRLNCPIEGDPSPIVDWYKVKSLTLSSP